MQRDIGYDDLANRATDGFVFLERIGVGGFSAVYRAMEAEGERRLVAVKVMHATQQRLTMRGRAEHPFEREARLSRVVKDPGIARVYKTGQLRDGRYYASMELVDAMTLRSEIDHRRVIPWPEAMEVILSVARSIASLHAEQIIHRDLSPNNVMVRLGKDGRVRVKLIDLGSARLSHELDSARDGVEPGDVGTSRYYAPEQARGEGTSTMTDVYALGAILYEMVTGRPVIALKNPEPDLYVAYLAQGQPLPSVPLDKLTQPDFPQPIARLIEAAIARDPGARPPDAAAFVTAAEAALAAAGPPRKARASGFGSWLGGLFKRSGRSGGRFTSR